MVTPDPRAAAMRREILERYERVLQQGPTQRLGIGLHAGGAEARAAFLALARRFHPDALDPENRDLREQAQAIFVALNDACRRLGGHRIPEAKSASPAVREPAATPRPPASAAPAAPFAPAAASAPAPRAPSPRASADPSPEAPAERRALVEQAMRTAEAAIRRERSEEAVRTLHGVLPHAEPEARHRARLLLARAYVSDPRWRRFGLTLLGELTAGSTPDPQALVMLGALYRREGLLARAEATLGRALAQNPSDAEARGEIDLVRAARGEGERPARGGWADRVMRHVRRAR